ncbi:hypothetical protein R6Q59_012594 [Mikania micrantha]|uniref:Uncharacterized protein n=1 Tax=Mikania micrantha TaxID=192012 RepID=A0A5N6LKY1_9ASTR|nr:hypothetical protein E3N88_39850 [Mikania micrantha]
MSNKSTMNSKKCVDCGQIGHISTECKNGKVGSFYLFGVMIDPLADPSEEDDNLQVVNGVGSSNRESKSMEIIKRQENEDDHGYVSDHEHGQDKKKGVPWTEDEHRSFLDGLEKLGRGNWRAISKKYVPSRTPTQVASHAQKYFIRMNAADEKRNRRSSLFDISSNGFSTEPKASLGPSVAPTARSYGVEGYTRFSNMMGYRNDDVPAKKCVYEENVYAFNRGTEPFGVFDSEPLSITNGVKWTIHEPEVERTKDRLEG